jgi:transcriptional regulator with XRE-family HTH domain
MSESNIPRLRELRLADGLTQSQLADALGVHKRTVLRWEAGDQDPNLTDLRMLAHYFGVSVAEMVGEAGPGGQRTT